MPTSLMAGAISVLVVVAGVVLALYVLYVVVRAAVRDGIVAASREVDVESVRSELRLGPERSPNSRRP